MRLFRKMHKQQHGFSVFSQEGEDLILNELIGKTGPGFYVDIGAFDPWRFSNTAFFYAKGWRGLNVDARPGFKILFDQERPNDMNIECAVGGKNGAVKFYSFDEPALNTTCKKRATFLEKSTSYKVKSVCDVPLRSLTSLLCQFGVDSIDFLSIDVEGAELEVLRSGDWKRYRPQFIVLEILDTPLKKLNKNSCIKMMEKYKYEVVTKGLRSVILKNQI